MDRKQVLVPGGGGGGAWAPHGDAASGWGDGADRAEGAGAGSQRHGETKANELSAQGGQGGKLHVGCASSRLQQMRRDELNEACTRFNGGFEGAE